jgi:MFS superfamily sulfate permease-like transporter
VIVAPLDRGPEGTGTDTALGRAATVSVIVGLVAAVIAAATIWLLLTDPVTIASAVEQGEVSPLVLQLADVIYKALASLLDYL